MENYIKSIYQVNPLRADNSSLVQVMAWHRIGTSHYTWTNNGPVNFICVSPGFNVLKEV